MKPSNTKANNSSPTSPKIEEQAVSPLESPSRLLTKWPKQPEIQKSDKIGGIDQKATFLPVCFGMGGYVKKDTQQKIRSLEKDTDVF